MSWLKKTVLSVKKAKEWKKKIIIEDWCFCYNGLQRFSTLHRLRLQHALPVGVSGIISMLNLCDINEKFPNSNTWVHLSSIWLIFFSVSHLFSLPWFYLHADATWNRNLIYFHKTALILLKWLCTYMPRPPECKIIWWGQAYTQNGFIRNGEILSVLRHCLHMYLHSFW